MPGISWSRLAGVTGLCIAAAPAAAEAACNIALQSPADGATLSASPTFQWNGNCVGWQLQVSPDPTFAVDVTTVGKGTKKKHTFPDVDWDANVAGAWANGAHWRVRGKDALGVGSTSASRFFDIDIGTTISCVPEVNALEFTCTVTVDPPQAVTVTHFRADGLGRVRSTTSEDVVSEHTVSLILMSPDMDYTVEATVEGGDPVVTTTVTTGIPPLGVGSWLTMTGTSTVGLIGAEAPCTGGPIAVVYDTDTGDLVWYRSVDDEGQIGLIQLYQFTDEQTIYAETGDAVVEVDLFGDEIVGFDHFLNEAHHDIFRRDDQFYLLDRNTDLAGLTLDDVVIFDTAGTEIGRWHSGDHLTIPVGATGDYLHTNSVFVDEAGDIYISMLEEASLAKIEGDLASPDFGTPIWILPGDLAKNTIGHDIVVDWSQIGGVDTFKNQHMLHPRHDGRLMVLDNDHGRVLVFSVDEVNKTATMDAEYETFEAFCDFGQGTAIDTLAGNSVVGCNTGMVREYDVNTGLQIWEAEVECRNGQSVGSGVKVARWFPLDGWE